MALLPEVDPVTRSIVNTQLTDTLAHGSHVASQAVGAPVFQGVFPFLKGRCLLYFERCLL